MPSVAYAADIFSDGSAVEYAAEEAVAPTEAAAVFAEEADNDDIALQAVETPAEQPNVGYQVDPDSIYFYYGDEEIPDFTVKYNEKRVVNGQEEYVALETKAEVKEEKAATCTEPATLVMKVTIDGQEYSSKQFVTAKPLGHDMKEADRYIQVEPTHVENGKGYAKMVCQRCGLVENVNIDNELEAFGHDWEDSVTYVAVTNIKTKDGKVVLDDNGVPALVDVTKDGYYYTEVRCKDYGKEDTNGVVDYGVKDRSETKVVYAQKGVHAVIISQKGIATPLVGKEYTGPIDEKTIELEKCTEAGSYVVAYYQNDVDLLNPNGKPISEKTFTVAPHHMERPVAIEFNTNEDASQCKISYDEDGNVIVTSKSCYLPITYYEVIHCYAKGCPNDACDTDEKGEHYTCVSEDKHEVSRVEKTAQPVGKHIINTTVKNEITANDGKKTFEWLEELAKDKASYIKVSNDTSTCTEDGTATVEYICKVCKEVVETQTVKVVAKGHLQLAPVGENVVQPTCTEEGHYDAVIYCGRCNEVLYKRSVRIPRIAHTNELGVDEYGVSAGPDTVTDTNAQVEFIGDLVIDVKGQLAEGKGSYAQISREISRKYGSEYTVTANAYTLCTTCGEYKANLDEKPVITVDKVVKQGKDCQPGSITLTETYTKANGEKVSDTKTFTYYTTMDSYHGRTAHDPAPAVKENVVEATATENGSYDEVVYCSVCGTEISRETVVVNATGDVILPAVTGLTAKTAGMKRVALSWDAVEGAEGYFVIGFGENRTGTQIAYTARTSWTDTAADSDAFNFYWVQPYCRNASGKIVRGELGGYKYALGRVVGNTGKVTAVAAEEGIELSWAAVSGANSYIVMSKTGSADAEFNADVITDTTTYVDKTAASGEVTYYWVYATFKNADGKVLAAGKTSPFAWAIAK